MAGDAERPRRDRAADMPSRVMMEFAGPPVDREIAADDLADEFILVADQPEFNFQQSIKEGLVVGQKMKGQRIGIEAFIRRVI